LSPSPKSHFIVAETLTSRKSEATDNCINAVPIFFSLVVFLQCSYCGLLDKDCKWLTHMDRTADQELWTQ